MLLNKSCLFNPYRYGIETFIYFTLIYVIEFFNPITHCS